MSDPSTNGSPDVALELRGLTKRYDDGTLALDGLDLSVPAGSFFGLLGPNGAGKTTLISAVCSLIRITSGEALVFGLPADCLEARRQIGISEQEPNLDRFLSVRETLVYMHDDMKRVPGLEGVAAAMASTLREIDAAERTREPAPLSPTAARFMPVWR